MRILPKIGPLKTLNFHPPTAQTESLFQSSFDRTLDVYRGLLADHQANLANCDFDTGAATSPVEYSLADNTNADLAIALAGKDVFAIDSQPRGHLLKSCRDPNLALATSGPR